MKIIHTSDWHLGKKTEGFSRLKEQSLVLDGLIASTARAGADFVIVSGDVFDTCTPPAEAEELFFQKAIELSRLARLIVIAGNHDDAERLCAPSPLARLNGIYLIGGLDNTVFNERGVTGGRGFVTFEHRGERLNLAALPFPTTARLSRWGYEGGFGEQTAAAISDCCACFTSGGVNVFASHLFVTGAASAGDERELGSALLLGSDILPCNADYTALGHIHRAQTVSKSRHGYYSGSILPYSFDDGCEKSINLYDSATGEVSRIPLTGGRPLLKFAAADFDEAEGLLRGGEGALVQLVYSGQPLSAADTRRLKSYECLKKLTIESKTVRTEVRGRTEKSSAQLFEAFYKAKKGTPPPQRLADLFLDVIGSER